MKILLVKLTAVCIVAVFIASLKTDRETALVFSLTACAAVTALQASLTCAAVVYLLGRMNAISQSLQKSIRYNSLVLGVMLSDESIRDSVTKKIQNANNQFIENCILSFACVIANLILPYLVLSDFAEKIWQPEYYFSREGVASGIGVGCVLIGYLSLLDSFRGLKQLISVDGVELRMGNTESHRQAD